MAQGKRPVSPMGSTAEEGARHRAQQSPTYRRQQNERADIRELAWLLIKYRREKGLSQQELAELVGTSHSQISRIESGRHRTNFDSLLRIARALDLKVVVGFESVTKGGRARRDLVTL